MPRLSCKRRPAEWIGIAAIAALATQYDASHAARAADTRGQLNFGGGVRTFTLHIPDAPPPRGGFPVVLAFHGGGGDGDRMRRLTGFDALADSRGVIVVYPDGIDKHWNDGRSTIRNPQDDVGFVNVLLDQLVVNEPVDRSRIYATGLSNGALFAERLGCDLATRIAAIAPVAGTLPAETARRCRPPRKIAVLQIDGTADPIMPFNGGNVADFGGRGEGGVVLPVAGTADFWARHNGCGSAQIAPLRPVAPLDPTRIVAKTYAGCPAAAPVKVMIVEGGGHTWPGGARFAPVFIVGRTSRQFDASGTILDFFLGLP